MGGTWWYFIQPVPLTQILDYVSGTSPIYIGECAAATGLSSGTLQASTVWRIKKLTYDGNGNVTNLQWSPLYNTFGDVWNNRTSITYS